MMKIFKDKKNIAIAAALFLATAGTGISVFSLTKKPDHPPKKPETHHGDHFEKHERPEHREKCDEFKRGRSKECSPPKRDKDADENMDFKKGEKRERPEEPKKDSDFSETPSKSNNN